MSVFKVRSSDEKITPANDRFSKADGYHVVPPPIIGYFLTPRADISFTGLDEYAIRKKIIESKITKLNTDTSKSKTSETVDDEDDGSAVKIVSPVKTNETQTVRNHVDKIGVLTRIGLVNPVKPNWKRTVHTISIARPINTARPVSTARPFAQKIAQTGSAIRPIYPRMDNGNPASILQDHAVVDSGCSSHMIGNKAYISDYKDYNEGFVAFGSDPKGGKITGKGKIRTANLDFDDVYFIDELKFNLFFVSQMCDKNINKPVKGYLVRGLPSKVFVNDYTCVACKKGKQHKVSSKAKLER
ncbi:hypothetical protein Tco_1205736, partial [Tanacetum coccineum]